MQPTKRQQLPPTRKETGNKRGTKTETERTSISSDAFLHCLTYVTLQVFPGLITSDKITLDDQILRWNFTQQLYVFFHTAAGCVQEHRFLKRNCFRRRLYEKDLIREYLRQPEHYNYANLCRMLHMDSRKKFNLQDRVAPRQPDPRSKIHVNIWIYRSFPSLCIMGLSRDL